MFCKLWLHGIGLCHLISVLVITATVYPAESQADCRLNLINNFGILKTPNTSCKWKVTNNDMRYVLIFRITQMDMPCSKQSRLIIDDSPKCSSLENNLPIIIISRNSENIKFYRAKSFNGNGFELEIFKGLKTTSAHVCPQNQFPCGTSNYCILSKWLCNGVAECEDGSDEVQCADAVIHKRCGGTLTGLKGSFHSPNFPKSHPYKTYCEWHIEVLKGQKIELYFDRIELDQGDTFTVYDGRSDRSNLIDTYTDTNKPKYKIKSSNNSLFVEFRSSSIGLMKGFNASYQVKGYCLRNNTFSCEYGEDMCYNKTVKCDGVWNCPLHGGDERGCRKCPLHMFECGLHSSKCYEEKDRCNGQTKCANNEDELNCRPDKCGPKSGTFLCQNSRCIIESWTCDGANDCGDNSDELHCTGMASRKVITAAVVGALSCSLLLVIALGCTCRLHAMRVRELMGYNYMSPVSRVQQEIWARRSAPPLYDEAMQTSRPYDEMVTVIEQVLRNRAVNSAQLSDDVELLDSAGNDDPRGSTERSQNNFTSDDELLDIGENRHQSRNFNNTILNIESRSSDEDDEESDENDDSSIGASNVEITLMAGASAQWRRSASGGTRSKIKLSLPVTKQMQIASFEGISDREIPPSSQEEDSMDSSVNTSASLTSDNTNNVITANTTCDIETNNLTSNKQEDFPLLPSGIEFDDARPMSSAITEDQTLQDHPINESATSDILEMESSNHSKERSCNESGDPSEKETAVVTISGGDTLSLSSDDESLLNMEEQCSDSIPLIK